MSRITIIWSAASGACLMLALMHLLVWCRDRRSWANLCFAATVFGAIGLAVCEMILMTTDSTEVFGRAIRWTHVVYAVGVAGSLGFVHFYFGTGKRWLLGLALGLRFLVVVANFTTGANVHIHSIQSLQKVTFLGEQVSILGEWVPNPWVRLAWIAVLVQLAYMVDASVRLWRKGSPESQKRAVIVGGALVFFYVFAVVNAALVAAGVLRLPFITSFPFLGMLLAMGYELSRDVLRAACLSRDLQTSEQRLKQAAAAARLAFWEWNIRADHIWVSATGRELYGVAPEEQIDFKRFASTVHADDRESVKGAVEAAISGPDPFAAEYRVMLPNGDVRWIAADGRVERDAQGHAMLLRGVSVDITQRKQSEKEMLLLRQEVAHADRVSMMGQLASALAHEINQPLGAILRNAEAAELFMQHASPDLEEIRAILSDIHKDDLRASAVIERMRALMRRHEVATQPLDVAEFVGDVTALTRSDAAMRRVKLEVAVPPDLPPVHGDRVHLQQVLLNLIINGMDAMSDTAEKDRRITVSARRDGGQAVEIAVSDSGSGIPADKLAQIFDPFFTTKTRGMGMGLAISRTIIEAHGGRLWAENRAGGGATFRFTLPIAEEVAVA